MSFLRSVGTFLKSGVSLALDFFKDDATRTRQVTGLSEQVSTLSTDIDAASQLRESLVAKINAGQARSDEELRKYKSELETVEKSIKEMERDRAEATRQLECIIAEVLELRAKVSDHDKKLADHDKEFVEVKTKLSTLESQNQEFMKYVYQLARVENQQAALQKEFDKDHKRLDRIEDDVTSLKRDVKTIQSVLKTDDETGLYLLLLNGIRRDDAFKNIRPEPICVIRRSLSMAMFNKFKNKSNVLVLAKTTEGRHFGFIVTQPLGRPNQRSYDVTLAAFVICPDGDTPFEVFPVLTEHSASIFVKPVTDSQRGFFNVGVQDVGQFWIGTETSDSYCENLSAIFKGLGDDGLTGHSGQDEDQVYHCESVVVFELINEDEEYQECEDDE